MRSLGPDNVISDSSPLLWDYTPLGNIQQSPLAAGAPGAALREKVGTGSSDKTMANLL